MLLDPLRASLKKLEYILESMEDTFFHTYEQFRVKLRVKVMKNFPYVPMQFWIPSASTKAPPTWPEAPNIKFLSKGFFGTSKFKLLKCGALLSFSLMIYLPNFGWGQKILSIGSNGHTSWTLLQKQKYEHNSLHLFFGSIKCPTLWINNGCLV